MALLQDMGLQGSLRAFFRDWVSNPWPDLAKLRILAAATNLSEKDAMSMTTRHNPKLGPQFGWCKAWEKLHGMAALHLGADKEIPTPDNGITRLVIGLLRYRKTDFGMTLCIPQIAYLITDHLDSRTKAGMWGSHASNYKTHLFDHAFYYKKGAKRWIFVWKRPWLLIPHHLDPSFGLLYIHRKCRERRSVILSEADLKRFEKDVSAGKVSAFLQKEGQNIWKLTI